MEKLNFKEVIANIKEGEIWEDNDRIISCKNGSILMKNKNMIKSDSKKERIYDIARIIHLFQAIINLQ